MPKLSNIFKKSDAFNKEFYKIFTPNPFSKINILSYISACTDIVLYEAANMYPEKGLKFINPIFVVDKEIYPASNLKGDVNISNLMTPSFGLVKSKTIIPFSLLILDNLLSGVCLCSGNTFNNSDYKLFKAFDLDQLSYNMDLKGDKIDEQMLQEETKNVKMNIEMFSNAINLFSKDLSITNYEDRTKLIKTLILYKNISKTLAPSLVYSFVNKYNQTHSFFDCMFTVISEKPFDEDELLDFANIIEGISLPIINYDYNKSKGVSPKTMALRNSLKYLIENDFKHA